MRIGTKKNKDKLPTTEVRVFNAIEALEAHLKTWWPDDPDSPKALFFSGDMTDTEAKQFIRDGKAKIAVINRDWLIDFFTKELNTK
jgi:hypothetical protein